MAWFPSSTRAFAASPSEGTRNPKNTMPTSNMYSICKAHSRLPGSSDEVPPPAPKKKASFAFSGAISLSGLSQVLPAGSIEVLYRCCRGTQIVSLSTCAREVFSVRGLKTQAETVQGD